MRRPTASGNGGSVVPSEGNLRFLYSGTADFDRDLAYYRDVLGARLVWHFDHLGAKAAAVSPGVVPLLLLAGQRPASCCMPVYQVYDLAGAAKGLRGGGWKPRGRRFEIPNGPCYRFDGASGNSRCPCSVRPRRGRR